MVEKLNLRLPLLLIPDLYSSNVISFIQSSFTAGAIAVIEIDQLPENDILAIFSKLCQPPPTPAALMFSDPALLRTKFKIALDLAPALLIFPANSMTPDEVQICRERNILTCGLATSLKEAKHFEQIKTDAILLKSPQVRDLLLSTIRNIQTPLLFIADTSDMKASKEIMALGAQMMLVKVKMSPSDETSIPVNIDKVIRQVVGKKLQIKNLLLPFIVPTILGKTLILYFGLHYADYPGEGYGFGLAAAILFTTFSLARFAWKFKDHE